MKDLLIALLGLALLCCLICGTLFCESDCGNAKVVRGVDTITLNQDSIESAYWKAKSDSANRTKKKFPIIMMEEEE